MANEMIYFPRNKEEIDEYVDVLLEKTLKKDYDCEKMFLHSMLHMMFASSMPASERAPHSVLYLLQMTAEEDEEGMTIVDKLYMTSSANIDNPGVESIYWYLKTTEKFGDFIIRLIGVYQFYDRLFDKPVYSNDDKELIFYPNHLRDDVFTIPDGIEKIAAHSISNNPYLKTIKIPKSVKSIGNIAFSNLKNLKAFIVDKDNKHFFSEFGVLFKNKERPEIVKYPSALQNTFFVVKDNVKKIWSFAFEKCSNIKEVTFESSKTKLDNSAFFSCEHLDNIAVLDGNGQALNPSGFNGLALESHNKNEVEAEETEANMHSSGIKLEVKTPSQIKEMFDDYIVGHEDAKRTLAVAVYSHILRCNNPDGAIGKSNILLCGPTGCGKTEFARTIAKCLDVPFVTADATSITETGMKGNDPTDMLKDLLIAANNNLEAAEKGIIYIDEIDKLASFGENAHRESYSKGVQQGLLRIIEGGIIPIRFENPMQQYTVNFNTSNILFIVGGAFGHMNAKNNTSNNKIGFLQDSSATTQKHDKTYGGKLEAKDFIKNGMTQEFIGRFPVIVQLNQLTEDEIYRIMIEPKNSVVTQYQKLVQCIGSELVFEEELLKSIAKNAVKNGTGARGLRTIIEQMVEGIIFELPDKKNVKKVKVPKNMLETKIPEYITE